MAEKRKKHLMLTSNPQLLWDMVENKDGCWVWQGCTDGWGYGVVHFKGKHRKAHRVAYEVSKGPIPEGLLVLHKCDNPPCLNPDHLFLGTSKDNARDASNKGRSNWQRHPENILRGEKHLFAVHPERIPRGESVPWSKLKDDDVIAIRKQYEAGGVTYLQLGNLYGVCESTVGFIIRQKTWRHLL